MKSRSAALLVAVAVAVAALGTGACSALFDVSSLGAAGPDAADAADAMNERSALDGAASEGPTGGDAMRSSEDGSPAGDGATPIDGGGDARGALTEGGCPIGEGPAMARANQVCIDATEVTEAQYLAFTVAPDAARLAPSQCGWNTSFVPTPHDGTSYTWPPAAGDLRYPVEYVDWCDAFTYCAWAGKQLCGGVKPTDSIDVGNDVIDEKLSQWYQACSHDGERAQPYPGPYVDVCGLDLEDGGGPAGVAPIGTHPGCEGGYDEIFDMVGNVSEWVDSCEQPGPGSDCIGIGGDMNTQDTAGCTHYTRFLRNLGYERLGFRCCARPAP